MLHHSGQTVGLLKIGAGFKFKHDGKLATIGHLNKLPSYLAEYQQAERGGKQQCGADNNFAGITETPLQKIEIELAKTLVVLLKSNGEFFEDVFTRQFFDFGKS